MGSWLRDSQAFFDSGSPQER